MPEIHSARTGRFCWFEIGTTDQTAAKNFYGDLFGWKANDFPMGPDSFYTMFQVQGRDVAACYKLEPERLAQGIPPHWTTYVAVADVDATQAKSEQLGGTTLVPAFDVFDFGRMAVLQDPSGAALCVWQARRHHGSGLMGELNTVCWSELMTRDAAAATKYYTELFGWKTKVTDAMGFPYTHWQIDGEEIGGMIQMTEQMGPAPPHWLNYVSVENCDETVAKAQSLGGRALCPAMDIPNTGRFAVLQDPQGAAFAVIALGHPT